MLKSVVAARRYVEEQLNDMRAQVFEQPPSDWEHFQQLLGRYQALTELSSELAEPINQEDS